jgi:hypothetical protein
MDENEDMLPCVDPQEVPRTDAGEVVQLLVDVTSRFCGEGDVAEASAAVDTAYALSRRGWTVQQVVDELPWLQTELVNLARALLNMAVGPSFD